MLKHSSNIFLTLLLAVVLITASGCANKKALRPYFPVTNLNAEAEWPPHKVNVEWWYASGYLEDEKENLYFYQFTIFHGVKMGLEWFLTHIAVSDYSTGKRYFSDRKYLKNNACSFNEKMITCGGNSLILGDDRIYISAKADDFGYTLKLDIKDPAVWHGQDGIVSMGYPGDPKENSFYYSYPDLNTKGKLILGKPGNEQSEVEVAGETWFDRQWGNFNNTTWNWFSLRFDDGDNIMLFHFPETGHKEGTFISSEDDVEYFSDFSLSADSSLKVGKHDIGLFWDLEVPFKEGNYRIEPLGEDDLNNSRLGIKYWEGLFELLNSKGERVGYCVAEISRR